MHGGDGQARGESQSSQEPKAAGFGQKGVSLGVYHLFAAQKKRTLSKSIGKLLGRTRKVLMAPGRKGTWLSARSILPKGVTPGKKSNERTGGSTSRS